jgi:sn-glycerol 3-phosphate transport system substrate-binding protein
MENTMRLSGLLGAVAALMVSASASQAATEIQWWHAMQGELGAKLEKIANDFNASQGDFKIVPVYKGNYAETMTGAIAAFRAKQQPAIVQVFEVGTATMMAAKGAIYPVYELMKAEKEPFDPSSYLPAVTGYYSDTKGNLLSFPFNSSTPILYYNKDAFKKAGLDPEVPPKTWGDIGTMAKKLQASGTPCGLTVQWPSWILVENFSAWHNVPISTNSNGLGGTDTKLEINNPLVVKQVAQLAEWQKTKVFDYGGRTNKSDPKFLSGECAIFMASSGSRLGVITNSKFQVGFGMMPYWDDVKGAPQNSIIGGATLWVLKGRPAGEYKGVAKFFTYLSRPEVQAYWHQNTGYLPITKAAYELGKKDGFYAKNPGTEIAITEVNLHPPTENSKGLRLGSFVQIRDIIEEDLEQAFSGKKTAKEAMDDAVARGNTLLRQFENANK